MNIDQTGNETRKKHILLSRSYKIFNKIDHMLNNKTSANKSQRLKYSRTCSLNTAELI